MRGKYVMLSSFFFFLSMHAVPCEKLGIQKKKKNLEQDAAHILMKKLESLYKLSATDNSEVFNKEIESLKKQIDQLHQHGGVIEGENLGHLLESEAANESTKKTIFGVDEDDLDNYDADFIGQGKKTIIKGATDDDEGEEGDEGEVEETNSGNTSSQPDSEDSSESPPESRNPATAVAPGVSPPEGQSPNGRIPNVKYLDKLYDEILKTTDVKDGIHVPAFHSKYNDFRTKYEFTMNEREYQIVKNLFDTFFKKDGNSNDDAPIKFFKNVLNDADFQKQFDNFQHGLYGFAKRHNYLRGQRMNLTDAHKNLFLNALSLLDTLEGK
ncbi:merozoite surface protein 7 [Plasmodium cynomolgi strain B]|uniref:Merozoite surface protein 7 n=1 Tax=Plasmodium cynomolgi (strain B) TaxID=1120755 RepID=K6UYM1_PLACD|nr:merozoite surface protein 7 [Plasmodium cynomolgi strain B]GAB67710.1 merozoite surface protein 7 [Plasmodium cynomolgi strain B]